ncbi:MAG: hypothetical protein CFE44_27385, partial [Burkholderiales bacterium PBB4]
MADAEILAILTHADVSLIVTDAAHQAHEVVTSSGLQLRDVNRLGAGGSVVSRSDSPAPLAGHIDSPVLLVYTSGTTGQPKGALHTQAGLIANC